MDSYHLRLAKEAHDLSRPALESRVRWQARLLDRYRTALEDILAEATIESVRQTEIAEKALGRTKEDREIQASLDREADRG